jgi:hypothetical protein
LFLAHFFRHALESIRHLPDFALLQFFVLTSALPPWMVVMFLTEFRRPELESKEL